jgi:hypothetical protein
MGSSLENDNNLLKRYLALKLLRENIYFTQPNKYNAFDFLDDFPGKLKTTAGLFNEVPPALAIISQNPEIRKAQIREALHKIRNAKEAKSEVKSQVLHNMLTMGLGGIPMSVLLSSAIQLMGFRGMKGLGGKLRLPFDPARKIKSLLDNKKMERSTFLNNTMNDAATGLILGSAAGAAVPLLSNNAKLPDSVLEDAARAMQAQPYISSFPVSDVLSVVKQKKEKQDNELVHRLKNSVIGAGLGGAAGATAGALSPLTETPKALWSVFRGAGANHSVSNLIKKEFGGIAKGVPKNMKRTAIPMAAIGGLLGSLTKGLRINENENTKPYIT